MSVVKNISAIVCFAMVIGLGGCVIGKPGAIYMAGKGNNSNGYDYFQKSLDSVTVKDAAAAPPSAQTETGEKPVE